VDEPATSETKEEPTSSFEVGDIHLRALTILGTVDRTNQRKMMVKNLDWLTHYQDPLGTSGLKKGAAGEVGE
jgi:hypothetical protein